MAREALPQPAFFERNSATKFNASCQSLCVDSVSIAEDASFMDPLNATLLTGVLTYLSPSVAKMTSVSTAGDPWSAASETGSNLHRDGGRNI